MGQSKEEKNKYAKETYDFRKRMGFCVKCGKNRAFYNHVLCPECIEKESERYYTRAESEEQRVQRNGRRKEIYSKRKESGLCVRCGKKTSTIGAKCLECYVGHKKSKDAWRERTLKKGYEEAGLCIRCGSGRYKDRKLCETCLDKSRRSAEYARGFIPRQMMIENY